MQIANHKLHGVVYQQTWILHITYYAFQSYNFMQELDQCTQV